MPYETNVSAKRPSAAVGWLVRSSIVAPHAICHTDECMRMLGEGAFRAAIELANGRKPKHIVNREALSHANWTGRFHA